MSWTLQNRDSSWPAGAVIEVSMSPYPTELPNGLYTVHSPRAGWQIQLRDKQGAVLYVAVDDFVGRRVR